MTPLRLFTQDTETLEMREVVFHPMHQAGRYLLCNLRAAAHWMFTMKLPHSDYARFEIRKTWRDWGLHVRITVRGELSKLKMK